MKIVSLDPSINETGWACLKGMERKDDRVWDDTNSDWSWGVFKLKGISLSYKLKELVEYMIMEFDGLDEEDWLVVEWPQYFNQPRGQVSIMQGHLFNLAAIDTYVAGYFRLPPQNWFPITAPNWKGSVSKEITRRRFFKAMGLPQIYKVNHNAVDAVMMLLEFARRKRITNRIISSAMSHLDSTETA